MATLISTSEIYEEMDKAILSKPSIMPGFMPESYIDKAFEKSGLIFTFDKETYDITILCSPDYSITLKWNEKNSYYTFHFNVKFADNEVNYKITAEHLVVSPKLLKESVPLIKEFMKRADSAIKSMRKRAVVNERLDGIIKIIKRDFEKAGVSVKSLKFNKDSAKNNLEITKLIIPKLRLSIVVSKDNLRSRLPGFITTVQYMDRLFASFPSHIAKLGDWIVRWKDPCLRKCISGEFIRKYASLKFYEPEIIPDFFRTVEDTSELCEEMRMLADYCEANGIKYGTKRVEGEQVLGMFFTPRRALCYKKEKGEWCLFVMFRDYFGFSIGYRIGGDMVSFENKYYKCSPERALEWFKAFPKDMAYLSQINETINILGFLRFALAKDYLDDEAMINDTIIRFASPQKRWVEFRMLQMCKTPQELIDLYKFFSRENKELVERVRGALKDNPDIYIQGQKL